VKIDLIWKKRLNQMLDELKGGDLHMNMEWKKGHTLFNECFVGN